MHSIHYLYQHFKFSEYLGKVSEMSTKLASLFTVGGKQMRSHAQSNPSFADVAGRHEKRLNPSTDKFWRIEIS